MNQSPLRLLMLVCSLWMGLSASSSSQESALEKVLYEHQSNQWFEGASVRLDISDDGAAALFRRPVGVVQRVFLSGNPSLDESRGRLEIESRAFFCGSGRQLARFGRRGSQEGWVFDAKQLPDFTLPNDARLRCSADGRRVAYVRTSRPNELVVQGAEPFDLFGRVTAISFAPNDPLLYALVFAPNGISRLVRINIDTREVATVTDGLDAAPSDRGLAVAADGRSVYLPLASGAAPKDTDRHNPASIRWLGIYQIDLASSARRPIVTSAHDNFSPVIVGGSLQWIRNVGRASIVMIPAGGGRVTEVVEGQLPRWSPTGQRLSYVTGAWRIADWALNLDVATIAITERGEVIAPASLMVKGPHEDFSAAWSPDGRWIAYHSHRSALPVIEYGAPGSTDDIYLRRADDANAPELRLTDFGWEAGSPDWSPDGRKLLFSSWLRGGDRGIHKLWVLEINPESGAVLDRFRLRLPQEIGDPQSAAWSPDGGAIAIENNRGRDDRTLWVVKADGTAARRVVDYQGTTYGGVDWLKDGRTLVYGGLAGDRHQLFTVKPGEEPKPLSADSGNLLHPQTSPDGKWIAATRIAQSHQVLSRPLPE